MVLSKFLLFNFSNFLSYIDIKTGYIPYVEDSAYRPNQPSYRNILQKMADDDMNKTNGLGLCK